MKRLRIVSIIVLTVCCSAILAGFAQHRDVIHPAKSVRVVQTDTSVGKDGKARMRQIRQRLIATSGEWKETTFQLSENGSLAPISVYASKTGQFAVIRKADSLEAMGGAPASREAYRSTKFLREHKEFVGEGSLLGYKTFIWRVETAPGHFIEQHFAPEVSDIAIKLVKHGPNFQTIIEPVSIEFTDVTPEMIATPDLPISTAHLTRTADGLERQGQKDAAARVRAFAASKQQK